MINTNSVSKAKHALKTEPEPKIVLSQNPKFNRTMLESGNFDILLDIHKTQKQDKPKQIDSGLNHVLAKAATKSNVAIGIDLSELRSLPTEKKADALMRIRANISFCKKANTRIALLNVRDKRGAQAILTILGASSQQASQAIIL